LLGTKGYVVVVVVVVGASPTVFAKKIVSCIKQLHGKHPARLS
jgi:hypothetical protein